MDQAQALDRIKQHVEALGGRVVPPSTNDYLAIPEDLKKPEDGSVPSYQKLALFGFESETDAYAEALHIIKSYISRVVRQRKDNQVMVFGFHREYPLAAKKPVSLLAYGNFMVLPYILCMNLNKK